MKKSRSITTADAGAILARGASDLARAQAVLRAIAAGTTYTGHAFFGALVREVCTALGVYCAMVGRIDTDRTEVHTVAVHAGGEPAANFTYALAGSPCAATLAAGPALHRARIGRVLPDYPPVANVLVDHYLGRVLRSGAGEPLGVLAVLQHGDIDESLEAEAVLEIFAARAAAEFERLELECASRALEARHHGVLTSIREGVMILQADRIAYANEAAAHMLGVESRALVGTRMFDMVPEHLRAGWLDHIRQQTIAETARLLPAFELQRLNDGQPFWADVGTRVIEHDGGAAVLITLHDVTESRVAERRLRRAVAELAVAEDRQRRRLARDLHDHIVQDLALATLKLRTVGRPRAMRKGIAYDDLRALMDRIVREARSLVLEVCPSVLDDSGLAAAIEWLAERHTRVTGVPCTVYSSSAAPRLSSDEQVLVFQIVRELLMNARKHATPTRVRIEHGVRAGLYRVEVVDDGCGFDPDEAGGSSVGLGLDHARDRLDLAGGRIESDSVPGRGTRVRIAIPLRPSGAGVESDEGAADIR